MSNPPKVGDRLLARLDDGRTWDGRCVRFFERMRAEGRVTRELVLELDPKRNARLGRPNAGVPGQPRWVRRLVAEVAPGAEYGPGWFWGSMSDALALSLEVAG
jgi:hypothetical protein